MAKTLLVTLALLITYALGMHHTGAQANTPPGETAELLRELVNAQRQQAEALKALVALEQKDQSLRSYGDDPLRVIAHALNDDLPRLEREQLRALETIARSSERCAR